MMPVLLVLAGVVVAAPEPEKVIVSAPPPIEGVVVDEQGKPVTGAELFRIGTGVTWQGKSDAEGKFVVDRANGVVEGPRPTSDFEQLVVYQPGARLVISLLPSWSVRDVGEPVRIVLRRAKGVSIRVLNPDGRPVEKAKVHLNAAKNGGNGLNVLGDRVAATTGADGRARLTCVDPEDVQTCLVTAPNFGTQNFRWEVPVKDEVDLKLRAVGQLTGRVLADDPENARGMKLRVNTSIRGPDRWLSNGDGFVEITTGADGRFDIPALAVGEVSVMILEGIERSTVLQQPRGRMIDAGKRTDVRIILGRGSSIRGILRERGSGRPVVHALLMLRNSDSIPFLRSQALRTDDNGRFEVFVGPGPIRFALLYAGPFVVAETVKTPNLATNPQGGAPLDLPPIELVRGVDLPVVVRDTEGKPVAGASVEATLANGERVRSGSGLLRDRVTNERGELTLWTIPPGGQPEVVAWKGDTASDAPHPVSLDAKQAVTLVLSPENTMSLEGRVVDDLGKPIAGARVVLRSRRRTSTGAEAFRTTSGVDFTSSGWNLHTDADGRFRSPRRLLRYEEHRVSVRAPGMTPLVSDWFAPTTPSFFDLTLHRITPHEQAQIRANYDAGWAAFHQGDLAEAEAKFQSAVAEAEKRGVKDQADLAWWLASLGEIRWLRGKTDDGEALVRRALELRKKVLAPTQPTTADTLGLLGEIRQSQGKTDEAEALIREALTLREHAQGTTSPDYARALFRLGYFELTLQRDAKAEADLARGVTIMETVFGPEHRDLLLPLENRAIALWRLKRLDEAEGVYRRTVALADKLKGSQSPEARRLRKDLAGLLRANGKQADAEALQEPSGAKRSP